MLNPFPELLYVSQFFAPTLLRVAVGVTFFYLAYTQYRRRDEIAELELPIFGRNSWWYVLSIIFNMVVGAMLFFGFYTQIAALLGMVGCLKGLWLNRRHPEVVILSNGTVVLLVVILFSLFLTGAGAFAFDLPL
jgi:uncharacterized membrane protein YphA (DoxX/SURF4 family)